MSLSCRSCQELFKKYSIFTKFYLQNLASIQPKTSPQNFKFHSHPGNLIPYPYHTGKPQLCYRSLQAGLRVRTFTRASRAVKEVTQSQLGGICYLSKFKACKVLTCFYHELQIPSSKFQFLTDKGKRIAKKKVGGLPHSPGIFAVMGVPGPT